MAKTYSAIQTIVCAGGETSITFNNIPQNYTDLKIVTSARSTSQNGTTTWADVQLRPTNSTTGLSSKSVYGQGSGAYSNVDTNPTGGFAAGSTATTNTFSNVEIYIPNYTSSNNKSWSVDAVTENNGSVAIAWLGANLWANTSAITSLVIAPIQGSFVQYSTFTLYGIGSGAKATGGTVVGAGNYIYHTFTSSGTFQPTEQIKNAEVLVVAGGASAGWDTAAGAGAGGVLWAPNQTFSAGTGYTCTVGGGGAKLSGAGTGNNGSNSSFNGGPIALSAIGGGASATNGAAGVSGGSGGGGGFNATSAGSALQTSSGGGYGYGNAGGTATNPGGYPTGGGGGAGAAGGNSSGNTAGSGGVGTSLFSAWHYATQTGVNVGGTYYIAGGGVGGAYGGGGGVAGAGGYGGGGAGTAAPIGTSGGNALTNSGGGGGGGAGGGSSTGGGSGGSGLLIIRYPVN